MRFLVMRLARYDMLFSISDRGGAVCSRGGVSAEMKVGGVEFPRLKILIRSEVLDLCGDGTERVAVIVRQSENALQVSKQRIRNEVGVASTAGSGV
jgi:hypothetical protein